MVNTDWEQACFKGAALDTSGAEHETRVGRSMRHAPALSGDAKAFDPVRRCSTRKLLVSALLIVSLGSCSSRTASTPHDFHNRLRPLPSGSTRGNHYPSRGVTARGYQFRSVTVHGSPAREDHVSEVPEFSPEATTKEQGSERAGEDAAAAFDESPTHHAGSSLADTARSKLLLCRH